MICSTLKKRKTHSTLLFQKLLDLRDDVSPFTLLLDSLEQSGVSIVEEFCRRAKISNTNIVFISFTTPLKRIHLDVSIIISARQKSLTCLRGEIMSYLSNSKGNNIKRYLLIIDSLLPLASSNPKDLPSFLNSLIISSSISLLATYHVDIPLPFHRSSYIPVSLSILKYLATAILTVSSLSQVICRKQARDMSKLEPVFGLDEGKEGVLISLEGPREKDFVVNMELRRRSGRGVTEDFVFIPSSSPTIMSNFTLLDENQAYASVPKIVSNVDHDQSMGFETTFKLTLTEKQKKEREEICLPYFDAQKDGEGGRILYQMGIEDHEDFDDEEDEI